MLIFFGMVAVGILGQILVEKYVEADNLFHSSLTALFVALPPTGVFALLWDLVLKRRFARELDRRHDLSRTVTRAGLQDCHRRFNSIDWTAEITEASEIRIFVSYANTWRRGIQHALKKRVHAGALDITVILPDPDHEPTISELARRFSMSPDEISRRIRVSAEEFSKILWSRPQKKKKSRAKGKKEIVYVEMPPMYSAYRFSNRVYFTLFHHQTEQQEVPVFVAGKGGSLYEFVSDELDSLTESGCRRHQHLSSRVESES